MKNNYCIFLRFLLTFVLLSAIVQKFKVMISSRNFQNYIMYRFIYFTLKLIFNYLGKDTSKIIVYFYRSYTVINMITCTKFLIMTFCFPILPLLFSLSLSKLCYFYQKLWYFWNTVQIDMVYSNIQLSNRH